MVVFENEVLIVRASVPRADPGFGLAATAARPDLAAARWLARAPRAAAARRGMHRRRARVRSMRLEQSFLLMYGSGGRAHRLVPHFSAPRVQVSSD